MKIIYEKKNEKTRSNIIAMRRDAKGRKIFYVQTISSPLSRCSARYAMLVLALSRAGVWTGAETLRQVLAPIRKEK